VHLNPNFNLLLALGGIDTSHILKRTHSGYVIEFKTQNPKIKSIHILSQTHFGCAIKPIIESKLLAFGEINYTHIPK
jgi:hypothetical protein